MDENLHDDIEDLFHSALNENEATPSQKAWEEIDKRLDKESVVSIRKKYTTLKRIAILLLLLLGISVYEMNRFYNGSNLVKSNKHSLNDQKKSPQPVDRNSIESTGGATGKSDNSNSQSSTEKENKAQFKTTKENEETNNNEQATAFDKNNGLEKYTLHKLSLKSRNHKSNVFSDSSRQTRLSSKTFAKSKVKNSNPFERGEPLKKDNIEYKQISYYIEVPNLSAAIAILQSKDSIDMKNSPQSLLVFETKLHDGEYGHAATTKRNGKMPLSRFSITPFFSPDIAWYLLQDENINGQSGNAIDIEREETHEFSSTSGVLADYKINKHWGLQSGITLSNINIVTEPETIYAQPDNSGNVKYRINTSSGYGYILPSYSANPVIGDSLYAFTSTHSLRYIGIPVSVTRRFVKNKFTIGVQAGLSANFLTKTRLETTVEKGFDNSVETVNSIQGLKKVYISGLAGIGIDFKLNKKLSLAFVPTMRFALNSINKNATVKSFPMSFGSSVGLKMEL